MEAARSARQKRLDALRELRDAEAQGHGQASTSSSSIHPWRRAISNIIPLPLSATAGTTLATLRPPRAASDDEDDGDDDEEVDGDSQAGDRSGAAPKKRGKRGMEAKMAQLAEATPEGQLLRKYRNWDPSTGQARVGEWSTMKIGIEEETSQMQSTTLAADDLNRAADLDINILQPRKPNWDLRQHLDRRLKRLERRDREARLILLRQRLKKGAGDKIDKGGDAARLAEVAASIVGDQLGRPDEGSSDEDGEEEGIAS
ncbi:unnamed protein product [Jaminaea pallidilutea]